MTRELAAKVLGALNELKEKDGSLPVPLSLYREIVSIQSDARSHIKVPTFKLDEKAVNDKLAYGQPLLEFDNLPIDWYIFQDIFERVVSVLEDYKDILGNIPANWNDLDTLKTMAKVWYEGNPPETKQDDLNTFGFILHAALKPFLSISSEALLPSVNQEQWRHGYCPICGGRPDFAFLDKERGSRYLVCSRCDAEWLFQRIECPYCGNQEQDTLAYFPDNTDLYRLYICEKCKNYLKAIDLRLAKDEVLIPLERFITIDLDLQASKRGYSAYAIGGNGKS